MTRTKLRTLKPALKTIKGPLQTVPSGSWRDGKSTTQRGYDYRWQQARERFLAANPLCRFCAERNRTEVATVVDHKIPHRGDQSLFWDQSNWQPLCKPCHDGEKKRQEAEGCLASSRAFQP